MEKIEIKYITKELSLVKEKKEPSSQNGSLEKPDSFWPLRGISLSLIPGEAVGLIGINGAGKSMLMQILAGRLKQTTGFRTIDGNVNYASSCKGLDEKATGLENIQRLLEKRETDEFKVSHLVNGVTDFCELGEWLRRPVAEYSSGLYARLSLAIALFANPQLVLIDSVLNVLDIPFSQRVNRKIQALKDSGVAFVIADTNLVNIERFCERTLWLQFGHVQALGPTADVMLQFEYFQDWIRKLTLPEKNQYLADRQAEQLRFDVKKVYEEFKVEQFKNGFTRKDEPKMRRAFFKDRGADPLAVPHQQVSKPQPKQSAFQRKGWLKLLLALVCLIVIGFGGYLIISGESLTTLLPSFKTTSTTKHLTTSTKNKKGKNHHSSQAKKVTSQAKNSSSLSSNSSQSSSVSSASSSSSSSSSSASSSSIATQTINVNSGDTLEGLAQKYATTVDIIKQLNNISSESDLKAGSIIKVPK
ncbi:ATP-binding cassette domain-containing protein [Liquorilactobacillus vini]|uniref:Teichoic acid translocation ATP-binding protein n=1 Tax=Liquorilactobacillus vini DSM 20605 TaxID=1133569 RepID=A0A0R2CCU1_9LACO|nr:ATP-binding cassette domain-containing protein [Liquorilactobacillus vini]KRM89615.1 Teichoic acid translocation ATP-binding protein [Liquorilactobacillus vini DSM 20605]